MGNIQGDIALRFRYHMKYNKNSFHKHNLSIVHINIYYIIVIIYGMICYVKTTWDLPRKITRSIAKELSETPKYKKDFWELHKETHQNLCRKMQQAKKKKKKDIDPDSTGKIQANKSQEPCVCAEKNNEDKKDMST